MEFHDLNDTLHPPSFELGFNLRPTQQATVSSSHPAGVLENQAKPHL